MKKKMMIILATGLCLASQAVSVYGADYEYDDLGRVTKVVYEDGSSVTYTYDANGNIVEVLTGTEWEDEEGNETGNEAGSSGSNMVSGGSQEGNKALGDRNQSEGNDEDGDRSDGQGGSDKENEKDEENHREDGESIEGQEGNEAKEKDSSRIENVMAGILPALGIAALILIRRLRNGNWNIAGTGRENQDGEKDKDGRATKENREDGEAE